MNINQRNVSSASASVSAPVCTDALGGVPQFQLATMTMTREGRTGSESNSDAVTKRDFEVRKEATGINLDINATTHHYDALLLATFADMATKTVTPATAPRPPAIPLLPNEESKNKEGQAAGPVARQMLPTGLPTGQGQPLTAHGDNHPRPRAVSDTSVNDKKSSLHTLAPALSLSPTRKTHLDIQPQCAIGHNAGTNRVFYRSILKKKFSWKNYPPLEKFLIANRDEYLRHSTLNYTVQQKQYNNNLTQQMIELAAQYGLVFDDDDFSFVTIRDRIRCYYKSYVQSLKKRGILLGYAARKAGLVSDNDIEVSASTAGKIYVPLS